MAFRALALGAALSFGGCDGGEMIGDTDAGREECPAGQTMCGALCTNTLNDPNHCGGCGIECGAGEVCSDGSCGVSCPAGQTPCDGGCFDTDTEEAHCGGCGMACAAGETCVGGTCELQCPAGQEACDGACVNTDTDAEHCGACGQSCATGEVCADAMCAAACPVGQRLCAGVCVNTATDEEHCGDCGAACGAGELCLAGTCETSCPGTQTECDGLCFDLMTSRAHCGACGMACADGEACVDGSCTIVCPVGQVECGGACTNLANDRMNCGACDMRCMGTTPLCIDGACAATCGAGETECGNACVDVDVDRNHCGACNNACTAAQVCSAGTCTVSTCPAAAPVTRWTGPGCSAATLECLVACTDTACQNACLEAAGDDCNNCIGTNWISCGNANGCGTDFNCLAECVATNMCTTYGCSQCTAQFTPYEACLNGLPDGICSDAILECFGSACPVNDVPLWTGTECSSSTVTCINACPAGDPTCFQGCLDADPNPADCNGCINQNLVSCFNAAGCQEQWNCYAECIAENGLGTGACDSLADRYDACVDRVPDASICGDEFSACFPGG